MNTETNFLQDVSDREIATSRVFTISKADLYKAWSDPKLLKEWWGPAGFTNTFHEFDLRPKGMWNFTMHGPNGANYENKCEFIEITPMKKMVWKHLSNPVFYVIATFDDVGENSKCTFRKLFETPELCEQVKKFALIPDEQIFDKLAALFPKK